MAADFDYYHVLGVPPNATRDTIRLAYREKARKAHPDMGGSPQDMLNVNRAWAVLNDPATRSAYDQARARPGDLVLRDAWNQAEQAALARATDRPPGGQDFGTTVGDVERSPAGRVAAGVVAGIIVGALIGLVAGRLVGIGAVPGALMGLVTGALGGAVAGFSNRPPGPP